MRTAVAGGLLVASNVLWFRMLRAMRESGYPVTVVNFFQDLRSYRNLIFESNTRIERLRFSLALVALYLLIGSLVYLIAS